MISAFPGPTAAARLLCLLSFLMCASGAVFDLENSAPYLRVGQSHVRFSSGWDAFVVADGSCTRVNSRGVYSKPSHWAPRDLGQPWVSLECVPGLRGALCELRGGLAFPEPDVQPRYHAERAPAGLGCSRSEDGRVLDAGYGYDVTACDVLDQGGDVVYCGRTLSAASTDLHHAVYWVLSFVAVFVVRSLSYLVLNSVGRPSSQPPSTLWTVLACLLVLPLVLVPHGDTLFVTVEEALFFGAVCGYLCLYAALYFVCTYLLSDEAAPVNPPIYNMIAAALQLIACRLYLSAETPYNPVIVWGVGARALVKMRTAEAWGWVNGVTTLADALVLSLMCAIGLGVDRYYLVAIFTLSMAAADAML
jgi:hypothetical protein